MILQCYRSERGIGGIHVNRSGVIQRTGNCVVSNHDAIDGIKIENRGTPVYDCTRSASRFEIADIITGTRRPDLLARSTKVLPEGLTAG